MREKDIKDIRHEKEEVKLCLLASDPVFYKENPKGTHQRKSYQNRWKGKQGAGSEINRQKSILFLYISNNKIFLIGFKGIK